MFSLLFLLPYAEQPPYQKEFDKECFKIFIRRLNSDNLFDKDAKKHFIYFTDKEDEVFFVKKVDYGNEMIRLRKSKAGIENRVITIEKITKAKSGIINVTFTTKSGGSTYYGSTSIKYTEDKPSYLKSSVISSIE